MRIFLVCILLSFFAAAIVYADPGVLKNKHLKTESPNNDFALCVAQQAVTQLLSKNSATANDTFYLLLNSGVEESVAPYKTATINFMIANSDKSEKWIITASLNSLDSKGWQLVQSSNGEIYPFSSTLYDHAQISSMLATEIINFGPADLTNCK
jgi:hypothetical protein